MFKPLTVAGLGPILLACCLLGGEPSVGADTVPATQECYNEVVVRFGAPHYLIVRFTQDTTFFPQPVPEVPDKAAQGKLVLVSTGSLSSTCLFAERPGGFVLYDSVVDPESVAERAKKGIPVFQRETVAYTRTGIRRLIDAAGQRQPQLQVLGVGRYPLPSTSVIDVALGLRCYGAADWISKDELEQSQKSRAGPLVTFKMSRGNGVVDAFTYDTSRGCVVTEYRLEVNGELAVLLKSDHFDQFGGAWLPRSISMSGFWPSSGIPKPIETDALIVRSVDTSGNANTEKLYNFQTVPNAQIVKDPASTRPALQAERVGLTPALRRSLVAPRAEQSAPDNISAFISVSDQSFEFKSRRLSSVEHVFTVANISSKPLTISGILRECSCVGTPDVPIDIDANSAVNLHVVVSVGDQPGPFAKKLVVQFSQGGTHAFSLVLGIKGEITE